jgi:hypothetical protein
VSRREDRLESADGQATWNAEEREWPGFIRATANPNSRDRWLEMSKAFVRISQSKAERTPNGQRPVLVENVEERLHELRHGRVAIA